MQSPIITFNGGLVFKGELMESSNGDRTTKYIRIRLARNYSKRQPDGSYKDIGTTFVNATAFNGIAEAIAASDIPLGTQMFVTGSLNGNVRPAYEKDGVQYPESFEEQLNIESIGVDLSRKISVTVHKNSTGGTATATATTQTASKPVAQTETQPTSTGSSFDDLFA